MEYKIEATQKTPALIIYLIDISGSMNDELDGVAKIEHVHKALQSMFVTMIRRSKRGESISDRYRIVLIGYNDQVLHASPGPVPISVVARMTFPRFQAEGATNTHAAFVAARDLLRRELPSMPHCPAPMVCHITDGQFTTQDPEPVAREIMSLSIPDGQVLVENVYVGPNLTQTPIQDSRHWAGIQNPTELSDTYAQKLFRMSSPLPASYAGMMNASGYGMQPGSRMLIPGTSGALVQLAFTMSGATPIGVSEPAGAR